MFCAGFGTVPSCPRRNSFPECNQAASFLSADGETFGDLETLRFLSNRRFSLLSPSVFAIFPSFGDVTTTGETFAALCPLIILIGIRAGGGGGAEPVPVCGDFSESSLQFYTKFWQKSINSFRQNNYFHHFVFHGQKN